MAEAQAGATSAMFARSAQLRAFARAMGDDMSMSTAGFASPAFGTHGASSEDGEILDSGF